MNFQLMFRLTEEKVKCLNTSPPTVSQKCSNCINENNDRHADTTQQSDDDFWSTEHCLNCPPQIRCSHLRREKKMNFLALLLDVLSSVIYLLFGRPWLFRSIPSIRLKILSSIFRWWFFDRFDEPHQFAGIVQLFVVFNRRKCFSFICCFFVCISVFYSLTFFLNWNRNRNK